MRPSASGKEVLGSWARLMLPALLLSLPLVVACASSKGIELPRIQEAASSHNRRGVEWMERQAPSRALREFESALKLNTSIDNREGAAVNLLNMSRIYLTWGRPVEGEPWVRKALVLAESLRNDALRAEAYATMGKYLYLIGHHGEALRYAQQASELDSKTGPGLRPERINLLGAIYLRTERWAEAEAAFNDALQRSLSAGDAIETANSHRGLGEIFERRGLFAEARMAFERALDADKKAGSSIKIAHDLSALGNLSMKEKDYETAIDYLFRAYQVCLQADQGEEARASLELLIRAHREKGDEAGAKRYEQEKMELRVR